MYKKEHNKFKERIIGKSKGKKVQAEISTEIIKIYLLNPHENLFLVIVMNIAQCIYRIFTVSTDKGRETF
jgi:hypothetical protein